MNESTFVLVLDSEGPIGDDSPSEIQPNAITPGFHEGRKYKIRKPHGDFALLVDDEPIQGDDSHWLWEPGYYAGQVRAELLDRHDVAIATYTLDVSPHSDKLGKDAFQEMLDEIWKFDPSLVLGTEPAKSAIGHQSDIQDPWLEYARLRTYAADFANALTVISRRPIRELRAERALVPLQYVRRADRQTALAALRNPHLATAIAGRGSLATTLSSLPLFDVPVARESLDASANRCIAAITQAVTRRAIRLRKALSTTVDKEVQSDTRSDLASRWPRRKAFLDGIIQRLRLIQKVSPIIDVRRPEISAAGLNAVSADPTYARAYNLGWRILRHGVEGPPDGEQLWISPTWEIYERWCFVRLASALQDNDPNRQWEISRRHKSGATAALTGREGEEAQVELLLQPKFPAGDAKPRVGFRSISGMREPDIVLTQKTPEGDRWFVLDAKYRTTRPNVLDAMSSAHIYRDALRSGDRKPDVAVLLVPRGGGAAWMEQPEFIVKNRVGVYALDADTNPLKLIQSIQSA